MIRQTLIATALIAGLAAPAFAADNGHHDRGRNDAQQTRVTSHQTYQRQYPQPRYGSNNGNGYGYAYGRQQYHPRVAPPRARYEQRPAARRGYAWQPGYYRYDNSQQYQWIPGQYVQQPFTGAQYQPLEWQLLNGLWSLIGGNWQ